MSDLVDIPITPPAPVTSTPAAQPTAGESPTHEPTTPTGTQTIEIEAPLEATSVTSSLTATSPLTAVSPPAPALPSAAPAVPSTEEMESHLQQSGKLTPEISIQPQTQTAQQQSPLASLQPQNMLQTQTGPQPIRLPSEHQKPIKKVQLASTGKMILSDYFKSAQDKLMKSTRTITAIALTIQGSFGIYQSIKFIMVDYPHLEALLVAHQIAKSEINGFATRAVMLFITTILSMFFAMRIMHNKTGKKLNTAIGIILFLTNAYINNYLTSHFNVAEIISSPLIEGAKSANSLGDRIIEIIPFVEKNSFNEIEFVWYQ